MKWLDGITNSMVMSLSTLQWDAVRPETCLSHLVSLARCHYHLKANPLLRVISTSRVLVPWEWGYAGCQILGSWAQKGAQEQDRVMGRAARGS